MADDWWANRLGAANRSTSSPDSPSNPSVVLDIGTSPFEDQSSFNSWASDASRRTERRRLQRVQAQEEEDSFLLQAVKGVGGALAQGVGFLAGGPFQELDAEQDREQGMGIVKAALNQAVMEDLPGTSFSLADVGEYANDWVFDPIETPFIARTLDLRGAKSFWSGETWREAWKLADESSASAIVDYFATLQDPSKSRKDLDRLRRTNSLYGLASFGADVLVGWKLDPTVWLGKGIGEARAIHFGELPRSERLFRQARRSAAGERYTGHNPIDRYADWRGAAIRENFTPLWEAVETKSWSELTKMPMFRKNPAGSQIAYAMKQAVGDERLMSLTERASFGDLDAWREIRRMKTDPDYLREAYGTEEAATYIDAMEAVKTDFGRLQDEIDDIEKLIQTERTDMTERLGVYGIDPDEKFFRYYNQELFADLATKQARLEKMTAKLARDQKYTSWLDAAPGYMKDGNPAMLDAVNIPSTVMNTSRRTYNRGIHSPVHHVAGKVAGAFAKQPGVYDFHRVETGIEAMRRQFRQYEIQFGYKPEEGVLDDLMFRYTGAMNRDNKFEAFQIAREIEEQHLPEAIHQWSKQFDVRDGAPGISHQTIMKFLEESRRAQNEMAKALVTGKGAVYTTAPGLEVSEKASILRELGEQYQIEITDSGKKYTFWVDKKELHARAADMPVDPTQTANTYIPQNPRELRLAIKRDPEKWQALDDELRFRADRRRAEAKVMNGVEWLGTAFNRFWKPLQLFRLAWPQRVLIDENFRALAMLGMGPAIRSQTSAFAHAAVNAVNPLEHPGTWPGIIGAAAGATAGTAVAGPWGFTAGLAGGAFVGAKATAIARERMLKRHIIGNGPLADEVTGKTYSPVHETAAAEAPAVPAYVAPRKMRKRSVAMDYIVAMAAVGRREQTPAYRAYRRYLEDPRAGKRVIDPVNGKDSRTGFAVPLFTERVDADDFVPFMQKHRQLLGSAGYRLMFDKADGTVSVVRVFAKKEIDKAAKYAVLSERDRFFDIHNGHREWAKDMDEVNADLRARELAAINGDGVEFSLEGLDLHTDSLYDDLSKNLLKRWEYGTKSTKLRTRDGEEIEVRGAFGEDGDFYTTLASSNPAYRRLTDDYQRTLDAFRGKAVGYKVINPPDWSQVHTAEGFKKAEEYLTAWATVLNEQVRNSPIWKRMLDGESDEAIIRWMDNTVEGARIRRQIPHKGYNPEKWVAEHRQALDFYLPYKHLQNRLRDRKVAPSELRGIPEDLMPDVYGAEIDLIRGDTGFGAIYGRFIEKGYKALGTLPTDVLSRQPYFKGWYDIRMRQMLRSYKAKELQGADGTVDWDAIRTFEKLSREFALRRVKTTMYDLADEDNLTQLVRFMAPFWGAQQEAIVKWSRIIMERPETLARFFIGIDAFYDNFKVINEDDEEVTGPGNDALIPFGYDPNHRVVIQIPKQLHNIPPFDKMLRGFGSKAIAFGAANTAFQGDNPMAPSLGPVVVVPVNEFMRQMWKTHGTQFDNNFFYRWLFPVGKPQSETLTGRILEQLMPGWQKRIAAVSAGHDSRSFVNTRITIGREMKRAAARRGDPPPTPEEIQEATNWHFALRTLVSFGAPAAMHFRPKNQFYLDQYHRMQRLYGEAAFERFVEKFGEDAARYASSGSEGLIAPTAKAMDEYLENEKLIAKYPDWAGAIISPDAWADEFSSDAYGAQFQIELSYEDDEPLRDFLSDKERETKIEQRLGWIEYRKFMSAIDAELNRLGATSLQNTTVPGVDELRALKDAKVAEMREKYPGWSEDIDIFEQNAYSRVDELRHLAQMKRFDKRPEWQGVRQYLLIRDDVAAELDRHAIEEDGARSLQANENKALRMWFYEQVGQLIQDNPAFGEFYHRYLSQDSLERGSGAPIPQ